MKRIDQLKELLQQSPGDSFLQHALALEYIKCGDEVTARKIFEELLSNNPSYTGSYYHLAKLLERNGEKELALEWYKKGIEAATKAKDELELRELRLAYQELLDE